MQRILALFLCLLVCHSLFSQHAKTKFQRISLEKGLSQSTVLAMLQDQQGFMWFGTIEGLNRFDGYKFKVYRRDLEDPTSLPHNHISGIHQDKTGFLWVTTVGGGLVRLDLKTQKFKHYKKEVHPEQHRFGHQEAMCVFEDRQTTLWVGTRGGGLKEYIRSEDRFVTYLPDSTRSNSIVDKDIRAITEDRNGLLWIATREGLACYDQKTKKFENYRHSQDANSLVSNKLNVLAYDQQQHVLWIGADEGLCRLDIQSRSFKRYVKHPVDSNSLSDNNIKSLYWDAEAGHLMIGTNGGGLNLLQPDQGRFTIFKNDPQDNFSLPTNSISAIYKDKAGAFWIASEGYGLCLWDQKADKFQHFYTDLHRPSLNNNYIRALYEDENNILWVGTREGGLNRVDRRTNTFRYFLPDPKNPKNSLIHAHVRAVMKDRNTGYLWIGTRGGGISIFDPVTERFIEHFAHDPADERSLSGNTVYCILQDSKGRIWIGAHQTGLDLYEPATKTFKHFKHKEDDPTSLSHNMITTITEDRDGFLWISTYNGGVNRFNPATGKVVRFIYDEANPKSLSDIDANHVYQDSKGRIWIGTYGGGLNLFDPATQSFKRFTTKNGLPNDIIYAVMEDDKGILWLPTNKGIARFDPQTEKVRVYDIKDGLQSNEFNAGAFFKNRKNEIMFGGINGFNIFNPDSLKDNPFTPPIVLTDFKVFNKSVNVDDPEGILSVDISQIKDIELSYTQSFFEFEFAALNYRYADKNQYAYKLEGFDPGWNYVGTKRIATYTSVPPGRYVFKLMASNNDGVWNNTGISIRVTITPPFWQTLWFRVGGFLLVIVGLYGSYRNRMHRVQRKNEELERLVNQRTAEIQQQKEEILTQHERLEEQTQSIIEARNQLQEAYETLENKNHSITQSITYAQRIQGAILPTYEQIVAVLPESFILFKPRDIVSGDFYWFSVQHDSVIIIAADCTGHGVPGALMSMIGTEILNEIVHVHQVDQPNLILDRLHEGIVKALKQTETANRDGMDIVVCTLRGTNNCFETLEYAGAMNSLYYTCPGSELIEIKGDKQPIGGGHYAHQRTPYTMHTLPLLPGTTFYLCSDGYQDQFGGEQGGKTRKFMVRKFRELLQSIVPLPVEKQKSILETTLRTWQGATPQTDDILVIGFKV